MVYADRGDTSSTAVPATVAFVVIALMGIWLFRADPPRGSHGDDRSDAAQVDPGRTELSEMPPVRAPRAALP